MTGRREPLETGWQARPPVVACVLVAGLLAAVATGVFAGWLAGMVVLLAIAMLAFARMQWAEIDGSALQVRDARSGFAFRRLAAGRFGRVRFQRSLLPCCRVRVGRHGDRTCLVLRAPSPTAPTARAITLWMIVHGRRRTRIDPRLLDGLAAMPEHGQARHPYDASHA